MAMMKSSLPEKSTAISKGKSAIIPKPYTEYTIFFRLERAHILQSSGIIDEEIISSLNPNHQDPLEFPRPTKYQSVTLSPFWYSSGHKAAIEKKRKHRKRKGRLDLKTLSQTISASWRQSDPEVVGYCRKLAKSELEKYNATIGGTKLKRDRALKIKVLASNAPSAIRQQNSRRATIDGVTSAVHQHTNKQSIPDGTSSAIRLHTNTLAVSGGPLFTKNFIHGSTDERVVPPPSIRDNVTNVMGQVDSNEIINILQLQQKAQQANEKLKGFRALQHTPQDLQHASIKKQKFMRRLSAPPGFNNINYCTIPSGVRSMSLNTSMINAMNSMGTINSMNYNSIMNNGTNSIDTSNSMGNSMPFMNDCTSSNAFQGEDKCTAPKLMVPLSVASIATVSSSFISTEGRETFPGPALFPKATSAGVKIGENANCISNRRPQRRPSILVLSKSELSEELSNTSSGQYAGPPMRRVSMRSSEHGLSESFKNELDNQGSFFPVWEQQASMAPGKPEVCESYDDDMSNYSSFSHVPKWEVQDAYNLLDILTEPQADISVSSSNVPASEAILTTSMSRASSIDSFDIENMCGASSA